MLEFLEKWVVPYPIRGVDELGEFLINEPPKWVHYLRSRGIAVANGAWGVVRVIA